MKNTLVLSSGLLLAACGGPSAYVENETRNFCAQSDVVWNPELHERVWFRPDCDGQAIYPDDFEAIDYFYPLYPKSVEVTTSHPIGATLMSTLMVIHDRGGIVMSRGIMTPQNPPDPELNPALADVHYRNVDDVIVFEVMDNAESCALSEEILVLSREIHRLYQSEEISSLPLDHPLKQTAIANISAMVGGIEGTPAILDAIQNDIEANRCLVARDVSDSDPDVTVQVHRQFTRHRSSGNLNLSFDIRIDNEPLYQGHWGHADGPLTRGTACCLGELTRCQIGGYVVSDLEAIDVVYEEN